MVSKKKKQFTLHSPSWLFILKFREWVVMLLACVAAEDENDKVLGVKQTATDRHPNDADRMLSVKYHGDKATGDRVRFLKTNQAFDVLSKTESQGLRREGRL